MQIVYQNLKKGEIKVKVENIDDLWYLSHIIDINDKIKGQTIRKIKIGEKEQRSIKVVKKRVFIEIETEKIEFQENLLKVLGKIIQGPEDIKKGAHHSFNIEEGTTIAIKKENWLKFQLDKLKEAASAKQPNILICVLDREESLFALSKRKGYEVLSSIKGEVAKKEIETQGKGAFYSDIEKSLKEYSQKYKVNNIIVASPAFWKEELLNHIKDESLKSKVVQATCSSVGRNAIDEVLKRPEVREVLSQIRTAKEMNLVEDLLTAIAKKQASAYGIKEVEEAANAGAVKVLLITDSFIHKMREKEKYEVVDNIMKITDSTKGEIHIISSEHEGGKKLNGLGGIGALLRYKIN
jgi:protein pelota